MTLGVVWRFFIIYFMFVNLVRSEKQIWIWKKSLTNFYLNQQKVDIHKNNVKATRFDLSNLTIDVLVHKLDPYLEINSNTLQWEGFLGDTWNILRENLLFKSNFRVVDFKKGRKLIRQNKADVFLGALVYTEETMDMVFSQPYFRNWYHLYFKLPEGKPADYLHFKTVNAKLWLYILIFFKLLTFSLWFACTVLAKLLPKMERCVLSVTTFYLAVVASFLNTGYDLKLRSFTARLVMLLALFFGVLCYYALSASLVASLAVLDRPMPFSSLNELSVKKTHSLCMRNITFVYDSFTDSKHAPLPQWKFLINNRNCPDDMVDWKTIPKALCQDKVAILENRIIMSWVLQRVTCPVTLLPQRYFDTGNYIVFSKKFDQRKLISVMMLRMRSAGISRKLETKWIRNHLKNQPVTTGANQITFSHITGLLTIYSLMVGISLCILLIEVSCHYYYNKH